MVTGVTRYHETHNGLGLSIISITHSTLVSVIAVPLVPLHLYKLLRHAQHTHTHTQTDERPQCQHLHDQGRTSSHMLKLSNTE